MLDKILIGAAVGAATQAMPGVNNQTGTLSLNRIQGRPTLLGVFGWAGIALSLVILPLYFDITTKFDIANHVISLFVGIIPAIALINYYIFFICYQKDRIIWRNWRGKKRFIRYDSIKYFSFADTNKGGWVRFKSYEHRVLFRYLVFKFSHAQFDSDVLYGHIMYRSKCGRWPVSWEELEESGFLAPGVACDYVRSQLYFKF